MRICTPRPSLTPGRPWDNQAPRLSVVGEREAGVDGSGPLKGDAEIAGGRFSLGSEPEESFVFDNEKWAHPVEVGPFAMARAAVTQEEFAAFVDDGGYGLRQWWSREGWCWRQSAGAEHPLYWKRLSMGRWLRRHFDQWVELEPHLPAIHVNWYEAEAYCRWAGRRLPSEAEWEMAAATAPAGQGCTQPKRRFPWGEEGPSAGRANLDWKVMGCVDVGAFPAGDSGFGCRQMIGNLWEWTSSTFLPYPGFTADPYREYSEPWFGTRKVMRGGCWATRSRLIRSNYRNFQTPGPARYIGGIPHLRRLSEWTMKIFLATPAPAYSRKGNRGDGPALGAPPAPAGTPGGGRAGV